MKLAEAATVRPSTFQKERAASRLAMPPWRHWGREFCCPGFRLRAFCWLVAFKDARDQGSIHNMGILSSVYENQKITCLGDDSDVLKSDVLKRGVLLASLIQ